jgi:Ca2+-binding EF-hand superfamily protein
MSLNADQIANLKTAFAAIDANGDGNISKEELT